MLISNNLSIKMKKTAQFLLLNRRLLLTSEPSAQGFTMLEVLAGLMMTFAFFMGTLNAVVINAWMQAKAERQAQANYWIQQDLENIQSAAANQATDTTKCTSTFNSSYAGTLRNTLLGSTSTATSVDQTFSKSLANKPYTLTRSMSGSNSSPQILALQYTVSSTSDPSNLATLYTEVIPPKALACP